MTPVTIEDLRDPTKISGFRKVGKVGGQPSRPTHKVYYQAYESFPGKNGSRAIGPARATPEESAQDYCDYVNGKGVTPAAALKTAGHKKRARDRLPDDPEVQAALGVLRDAKGQSQGKQGFVYCIAEIPQPVRLAEWIEYVKIGYSTNPHARVAELQTGNPRPLKLLAFKPGTLSDEASLHAKYIKHNAIQEWFRPTLTLLSEFGIHGKDVV